MGEELITLVVGDEDDVMPARKQSFEDRALASAVPEAEATDTENDLHGLPFSLADGNAQAEQAQ